MAGRYDTCVQVDFGGGMVLPVVWSRNPRSRHVRLSVDETRIRVSSPPQVPFERIRKFLLEQRDWLDEHLQALQRQRHAHPPLQIGVDTEVLLRGERLPLIWRPVRGDPWVRRIRDHVVVGVPQGPDADVLSMVFVYMHDFLHQSMIGDVMHWLPQHTAQLGLEPRRIRTRFMTSRWGSMGKNGHMSLALGLALAPPEALHYVLVHELAHMVEPNHSPRFWDQVEALLPGSATWRGWLKAHSTELRLETRRLLGI